MPDERHKRGFELMPEFNNKKIEELLGEKEKIDKLFDWLRGEIDRMK